MEKFEIQELGVLLFLCVLRNQTECSLVFGGLMVVG